MPVHSILKLPAWEWFGLVFGSNPCSVPSPFTSVFKGQARQNSCQSSSGKEAPLCRTWGSRQKALTSHQCRREPGSLTSPVLISFITQSACFRGVNLRTRTSSLMKQFGLYSLEGGSHRAYVEFPTFGTSWSCKLLLYHKLFM